MLMLIALSVAVAEPAEPAPANVVPAAETRVCKSQTVTGSILQTRVCKPLAQWIEEARTDDPFEVELVASYGVRTLTSWEDD